jgi:predicted Fe-Mo cluster-binding NifX family protein
MMRIAVSSESNLGLESPVSGHFGRCPYFTLVDVQGREVVTVESVENPFYQQHQPGQVPSFIQSKQANVMLTGGMGRRAITFFQQFNIEPVTGAQGTVAQALEQYLGGALEGAAPCPESEQHHHDH